ncbi:MAG TPA: PspC domain-containing protein [Hanamia sp.]|nr:PspC domain-containing protein [Hanamia sp.]
MKKVININFQGTVVPIEESSYELLKQYIDSLRRYFANEEGRDEIINDIESRISELFRERLKNGATCITDDDVNAIIKNMGRPEDFEQQDGEQPDNSKKESTENTETIFNSNWNWKGKKLYRDDNHKILGGVCSGIAAYFGIDPVIVRVLFIVFGITGVGFILYILLWIFVPGSNMIQNGARKRLYRNPDGKIIGGVCSGLGSYFNVNPWIPRVLFLIPFISFIFRWGHWGIFSFPSFLNFSFSPGAFMIYIILWLVIPEANTTSEKLEMKGEKVDLNSIKNSVLQEMRGVGERVGKMGMEAGTLAKEKGAEMGQEIHYAAKRSSGVLGNIITTLFKVFVYFILGCLALALIVALFSIAIVAIGLFPLKDFVLTDGWQSLFAWGTLIFFIGVPVVGIITFIIRRIARIKSSNKLMRYSFIGLWILGIVCFISLLTSVGRDFKSVSSMNDNKVNLTNPTVQSLEVMPIQNNNYYRDNSWFRLEPFATFGMDDDTAFISNIRIKIQKSTTDSFQVSVMKLVNGRTRRYADTLAALINFNIYQNDSLLMMDKAIAINTTDKFRNQFVSVTIAVPVGHHIKINKNFSYRNRARFVGFWNDDDWYDRGYDEDYDFKNGVEYVMKEDGLYTLDGIRSDRENDWNSSRDDYDNSPAPDYNDTNYRYKNEGKFDSLKDAQEKQIQKMQAAVDSTKASQKKEVERIKDSLRKAKEEIDKKIEKLNRSTALLREDGTEKIKEAYPFIMNI